MFNESTTSLIKLLPCGQDWAGDLFSHVKEHIFCSYAAWLTEAQQEAGFSQCGLLYFTLVSSSAQNCRLHSPVTSTWNAGIRWHLTFYSTLRAELILKRGAWIHHVLHHNFAAVGKAIPLILIRHRIIELHRMKKVPSAHHAYDDHTNPICLH